MNRLAWGISLVLLSAALGAGGCRKDELPQHAEDHDADHHGAEHDAEAAADSAGIVLSAESRRIAEITTAAAGVREIHERVHANGEIQLDGRRVARIVSRVSGWIEEVRRIQGDRVGRGDIVLTINSPEYQTAAGELLRAQVRLDRARASGDSGEVETASAILASAKQRLVLLGESDEDIGALIRSGVAGPMVHVHSPFEGTVLENAMVAGHRVEAGSELCFLADLRTVWAVLNVFEKDLASVRIGSPAALEIGAYPGELFQGRVTFIDNVMDEATRTLKVRVNVVNPAERLKPGMFVDGSIDRAVTKRALTVPAGAVQRDGEEHFVFVVHGDRFMRRDVQPGVVTDDFVEIVEGLAAGDSVAVGEAFLLKSELQKAAFEEGHAH